MTNAEIQAAIDSLQADKQNLTDRLEQNRVKMTQATQKQGGLLNKMEIIEQTIAGLEALKKAVE